MKKLILLFLICFSCSIFGQNILFVGNSLTYSNNMPEILEYIGKQNGVNIKTKSLAFPNYAIIDHLDSGLLHKLLKQEQFDYIIIQQGPSSQAEGKRMLLEDGAKMKMLCNKYNIKLGYYMVWPSVRYYFTFDKVIENHTLAAKQNNALLFPVGKHWKAYNNHKNIAPLYANDNFHPSKAGSFLAALTIFHELYPTKNLQQLPYKNYTTWVTNEDSFKLMLQLIAH